MRGTCWLVIPLFVISVVALLGSICLSTGNEVPRTGKKPKKIKAPASEEEQLHKTVERLTRPGRTERDRFLKELRKLSGGKEVPENPENPEAESAAWFDLL